ASSIRPCMRKAAASRTCRIQSKTLIRSSVVVWIDGRTRRQSSVRHGGSWARRGTVGRAEVGGRFRVNRPGEQVPLAHSTAELHEHGKLFFGFDAFGDDAEME